LGDSGLEVQEPLALVMAASNKLPHDRGHLLWTAEDGPSRMLLSSMDRWISTILVDDGIEMPFMGGNDDKSAKIISKGDGLIIGTSMVDHLIQIWAPSIQISWFATDGKRVSSGEEIAEISGDRDTLLGIERSILNILGHLSGIATETKRWTSMAKGQIACTRKTVWGLLDKWAVHMGGGFTHRLNRYDAKMIKENDLATMMPELSDHSSRIASYLQEVDVLEIGAFLEIEVREEKEAITAAAIWNQREIEDKPKLVIMLDNFGPERSKDVASQIVDMGLRENVILEASGGIIFESLTDWYECGLDVLSTSALNRGVNPLDLSMLID
jgi:nicotinate-nucleotide pyrophosphorylase (carboxylating)